MRELDDWFIKNRRDFPWRRDPTPYRVWISEVMLQQTRASVVIPYFENWMRLFPNVQALASAPLEKVIKAWEGLGYYSRARHLHQGAQQMVAEFAGEIPARREDLASIRGIGPYTLGAILSFGFRQRAVAIDGNVARVLSRFLCLEENIGKQSTKRKMAEAAEALLDLAAPWVSAEALIELGATLCGKEPRCAICPLQNSCLAYRQNKAHLLPLKNEEKKEIELWRLVVWIEVDDYVLLKKGEKGKVMADLYEFPYFERSAPHPSPQEAIRTVQESFGLEVKKSERLSPVTHTFTRYKAHLYPYRIQAKRGKEIAGYEWISRDKLSELPFSSGHRRILKQ